MNGLKGPHVILKGVNLHLRNNSGITASQNGLGNLIIGYDEKPTTTLRFGSHNLIIGPYHNFTSYGGLVAGYRNTVSGPCASVSAGCDNTASNYYGSVSGGTRNTASGEYSSVSGGLFNTASGLVASVSGGSSRSAGGQYDWRAGELFQDQ